MATCECGGNAQSSGEFLPGHDQKLRAALERRVGGILRVRDLIEAAEEHRNGATTEGEFARRVRAVLAGGSCRCKATALKASR